MSSFTAGSSKALGWTTIRSSPTAGVVWEGGRVGERENEEEERGKKKRGQERGW